MKRVFVLLDSDNIDEIGLIDARLEIRRLNQHIKDHKSDIQDAIKSEKLRCAFVCEAQSRKYKNVNQEIAALQCARAIRDSQD